MRARKWLAVRLGAGAVALGLAAQLVPYGPDRQPPGRVVEPTWDSTTTRALADRACFDCHSGSTRWPWYASIAPVAWIVDEGRAALDFSRWDRPFEEAEEAGEVVREGAMPPGYYLALHPEARLSTVERDALAAGLDASVGGAFRVGGVE